MRAYRARVLIEATADEVWSALTSQGLILQWFVGLTTCKVTPNYPQVGSSMAWTYRVLAVDLKGTNTVIESRPGEVLRYRLDGLMTGTMEYLLTPVDEGISLEFGTEYNMSGGVLGRFAEPVAHQNNVENAKKSLANLARLVEEQVQSGT